VERHARSPSSSTTAPSPGERLICLLVGWYVIPTGTLDSV
jgi:hypothetical protein